MAGSRVGAGKSAVDPADKLALADVSDEQQRGIGADVQSALAQGVLGQRTGIEVIRLGAGPRAFAKAAAGEGPVAAEPRAGGITGNGGGDVSVADPAEPNVIGESHVVTDPL